MNISSALSLTIDSPLAQQRLTPHPLHAPLKSQRHCCLNLGRLLSFGSGRSEDNVPCRVESVEKVGDDGNPS